jgi:hypothetical protein
MNVFQGSFSFFMNQSKTNNITAAKANAKSIDENWTLSEKPDLLTPVQVRAKPKEKASTSADPPDHVSPSRNVQRITGNYHLEPDRNARQDFEVGEKSTTTTTEKVSAEWCVQRPIPELEAPKHT